VGDEEKEAAHVVTVGLRVSADLTSGALSSSSCCRFFSASAIDQGRADR